MPFPKTEAELRKAGYKRERISNCIGKECKRTIEWWKTPKGKLMPLDPSTFEPHWATCPNAELFGRNKEAAEPGRSKREVIEDIIEVLDQGLQAGHSGSKPFLTAASKDNLKKLFMELL